MWASALMASVRFTWAVFRSTKRRRLPVEPRRVGGRFHIGPGQIGVAVVTIILSFFFGVADSSAGDAPAVGGVIAHLVESADVAGLEPDRHCQNRSDAVNRLQIAENQASGLIRLLHLLLNRAAICFPAPRSPATNSPPPTSVPGPETVAAHLGHAHLPDRAAGLLFRPWLRHKILLTLQ